MSRRESFGFILEPDAKWLERKKIHIQQMADEAELQRQQREEWKPFKFNGQAMWQYHYEPSFHCDEMERIGAMGDGHKWVCNPKRIGQQVAEGKPCLIYSIGSDYKFDFEEAVLHRISEQCEIHTFDPAPLSHWLPKVKPQYRALLEAKRIKYHQACLGSMKHRDKEIHTVKCKSFREIVRELGHEGRDIDIFKIDCEGCEWGTFPSWLDADVNLLQINVELHYTTQKQAHALFQTLFKSGYVVHAKEPNIIGCNGACTEYGLLKLAPSFGVM